MTPIDPYWGYIEFFVGVILIIYFGNFALKVLKTRVDSRVKQAKIQADKTAQFAGISSLVENHEEILNQLFNLRRDQIIQMNKEGISPEKQALALKPLDQRIKYVEIVKSNSFWLQFIAPQADRIIGLGLRAVEKVLKSI